MLWSAWSEMKHAVMLLFNQSAVWFAFLQESGFSRLGPVLPDSGLAGGAGDADIPVMRDILEFIGHFIGMH